MTKAFASAIITIVNRTLTHKQSEVIHLREYLKKLRESKGLNQQDMAERIGISKQYYSLIENGDRQKKMDVTLISAIAAILGVPIEQIIEDECRLLENTN